MSFQGDKSLSLKSSHCSGYGENERDLGLANWAVWLRARTRAWLTAGASSVQPDMPEEESWSPKCPELVELYKINIAKQSSTEGRGQSDQEDPGEEFWRDPRVPFHPAPEQVFTHVSVTGWKSLTEDVRRAAPPGWRRQVQLAETVLGQLESGASSGVSGQGWEKICVENHFENIEIDAPRMLDALLNAIRSGYISGPHCIDSVNVMRTNGFLSIPKPGGERRQVGDMSSPRGMSFNDNVDMLVESEWPMTQLTAKKFSWMIKRMGVGALMGKSDLSQAYKCLPVTMDQRELQWFRFGNRMMGELRLVFGDCYAPKFFDRFHHVLLDAFVLIPNKIPRAILEKCIDDIPVVVPWNRGHWLQEFFFHYRRVCNELGVKLSSTGKAAKSFENATQGEVLGVIFNTEGMSWKFPTRKRLVLLHMLHMVTEGKVAVTAKQWEVLTGKLIDFYQLWPTGKFFIDSFLKMTHTQPTQKKKRLVRRDARVWITVLEQGDLPIVSPPAGPPPDHYVTLSDASGDPWDTPGLGILIPAQQGNRPRVAAWEFPRGFLTSLDESGVLCKHKTTALEALGPLGALLLAPGLLQGRRVLHKVNITHYLSGLTRQIFQVDNIATVLAWPRGRSTSDAWASTLVRATAHVCSALGVRLYTEWQPRCSDRESSVVDNLSHDRCLGMTRAELQAYLDERKLGFPDPLLTWMKQPRVDYNLGPQLVSWLQVEHPDLFCFTGELE